jgi:hypothetical protein
MTRHRLSFEEERAPCGVVGLNPIYQRKLDYRTIDISDCLVSRPKPWLLVIWEPLQTKAPAPPKAAPYCCYIKTVVFYHSPYIVRPWKRLYRGAGNRLQACRAGFEQWDQIETRLTWDDLVAFEGETFELGGGTVVWAKRRWWMRHGARRYRPPAREPAASLFTVVAGGHAEAAQ